MSIFRRQKSKSVGKQYVGEVSPQPAVTTRPDAAARRTASPTPPPSSPAKTTRTPASQATHATKPKSANASKHSATVISSGALWVGTLRGTGPLIVEGHFDGDVELVTENGSSDVPSKAAGIEIGEGGLVHGNLHVPSARIAGTLCGNLEASDGVEIAATGRLEGDLKAGRVSLAEGAFVRGNIQMSGERRDGH